MRHAILRLSTIFALAVMTAASLGAATLTSASPAAADTWTLTSASPATCTTSWAGPQDGTEPGLRIQ